MRLDLVVGTNGAGKSTFVELVLARVRPGVAFVNADVIAAQRWPQDQQSHAYEAARVAEATRAALLARREPFIAETVFSHPSKLELIRQARADGYYTALHVVMVPEELSVARVDTRVAAGGHRVPEDKIRGRHRRLWDLVAQAIGETDTATCYDNAHRRGPGAVALFVGGFPVGAPTWPSWVPGALTERWPAADKPGS